MTDHKCTCPWLCSWHPGNGLTAAGEGVQLQAAAAQLELAAVPDGSVNDTADRIVSGLVLPYGREHVGYTSVGPAWTLPGRIGVPEDLRRVKLMDYHQTPPVAIGYCTAVRETPEGLRASFRVAATSSGDAAWLDIMEGVRDGLSVELGAIDLRNEELHAGYLLGVALVPIPAWENARHDGLAAAREDSTTTTATEGNDMTPEQRARLAELLGKNARTPEEEGEYLELVRLLAASDPDAEAEAQGTELAAAHGVTLPPAGATATAPATTPVANGHMAPVVRGPQRDVRELFAAMSRVLTGNSRPQLEAALSDITATDNIWTSQTAYDGQLWEGLEYARRFVQLCVPGPLNNYKGTGWKWVTKPEVADYAGDKAPVPSNTPETEATNWVAARLAGAHDIDRKFYDFGDTEFIAAYYAALVESYAAKSDIKALNAIKAVAAANALIAGATSMFGAAARAAQAVMDATGGVQPDYFLVNGADLITLIDGGTTDLPNGELLEAFGVAPSKFVQAPGITAGTVQAGVKQAVRFRELGSSPIRVETINLVNGGIDGGAFGYYATEAVHDGGVQRASWAPAE